MPDISIVDCGLWTKHDMPSWIVWLHCQDFGSTQRWGSSHELDIGEFESGLTVLGTGHTNGPPVVVDDLLDDRQAETGSFRVLRMARVEHGRFLFRRKFRAIVFHIKSLFVQYPDPHGHVPWAP